MTACKTNSVNLITNTLVATNIVIPNVWFKTIIILYIQYKYNPNPFCTSTYNFFQTNNLSEEVIYFMDWSLRDWDTINYKASQWKGDPLVFEAEPEELNGQR